MNVMKFYRLTYHGASSAIKKIGNWRNPLILLIFRKVVTLFYKLDSLNSLNSRAQGLILAPILIKYKEIN